MAKLIVTPPAADLDPEQGLSLDCAQHSAQECAEQKCEEVFSATYSESVYSVAETLQMATDDTKSPVELEAPDVNEIREQMLSTESAQRPRARSWHGDEMREVNVDERFMR